MSAGANLKYCFVFLKFSLYIVGFSIGRNVFFLYQLSCGSGVETISLKIMVSLSFWYCTYICLSVIGVCYWLCVFLYCVSHVHYLEYIGHFLLLCTILIFLLGRLFFFLIFVHCCCLYLARVSFGVVCITVSFRLFVEHSCFSYSSLQCGWHEILEQWYKGSSIHLLRCGTTVVINVVYNCSVLN